jgi:hypothetical protein
MAQDDPSWITARYTWGKCIQCGKTHTRGNEIFYYPLAHAGYCKACGIQHALEFAAMKADEDNYLAQYSKGQTE